MTDYGYTPDVVENVHKTHPWVFRGIIAITAFMLVMASVGVWFAMSVHSDVGTLTDRVESIDPNDGLLDYSDTLADAATTEIMRQSVRDVVFRYADADGNYVNSFVVTAIVISDEYVLVPAYVIPPADSGFTIIVAGMQASYLDPEPAVEQFEFTEAPLIDFELGVAAIRRPAQSPLDVVPLTDSIGDVTEVGVDTMLLSVGTVVVSDVAPNEQGRQVTNPGKVDAIIGQRIFAKGLGQFEPVYALRDGIPEVIGVSIAGSGGVVPIVTFYELETMFSQLGIQLTFPE